MNLYHLEYITEVAKTRNISEAAKNLHISQPTLSIYIKKLENDLGISLFQRVNSTLLITEAGEKYVRACHQILQIRDQLYDDLFEVHTSCIRLGTLSSSFSVFSGVLTRFKSLYPEIIVQPSVYSSEKVYLDLSDNAIDIGFVACYFDDVTQVFKDVRHIHVQEYEMMLTIHKGNPVYEKLKLSDGCLGPSDFRLLKDMTLIAGTSPMIRSWSKDFLFPKLFLSPKKEIPVNDISFVPQFLSQENCYAVLPYSRIDQTELIQIPFSFHPKICKLFIYKKSHNLSNPEKALIKIALEEFQRNPYYYHIPGFPAT